MTFTGANLFGQDPWENRGASDNRLKSLETRIVTLETSVTAMVNFIKATSAGKLIQSGTTVVTTDVGGGATITFPTAFVSAPVVVANNGDSQGTGADDWFVTIVQASLTTTTFTFVVNDSTGARVAGAGIRVNWMAFGT